MKIYSGHLLNIDLDQHNIDFIPLLMSNYIANIENGFDTMIEKTGLYKSSLDECISKISAAENQDKNELFVELAEAYKNECEYYLKFIHELTNNEIEAFIWMVVMQLDLYRGLLPGFKTEESEYLNNYLEPYEYKLWQKINDHFEP